jgi:hypothetical protein
VALDRFHHPAVHRRHRVLVLNDELRRPGERGLGRGAECGVEHGPAEVVERVPHRVRVLGPLAHGFQGREQLRRHLVGRHVQPERVDHGTG